MEQISIERAQKLLADWKKLNEDRADWQRRSEQLVTDQTQLYENLKHQNALLDGINAEVSVAGSLITPKIIQKKAEVIITSNQIKRKIEALPDQEEKLKLEKDTILARLITLDNEKNRMKSTVAAVLQLFVDHHL